MEAGWSAERLRDIVHIVLRQFALAPDGEHGVAHWARVLENGLRLAAHTGARPDVVSLFAVLHDSQRRTDEDDPLHGQRAAAFAARLNRQIALPETAFALLADACAGHAEGRIDGDVTIRTCWDADRLDLGRGGITPDPRFLCTDAARHPDVIAWATGRARQDVVPALVAEHWTPFPARVISGR